MKVAGSSTTFLTIKHAQRLLHLQRYPDAVLMYNTNFFDGS
jgi:hypothetical protein